MQPASDIELLKRLLPQCLLPDQVRLGRRLAQELTHARAGKETRAPLGRWLAEARASIGLREQRAAVRRHLVYPPELPITAARPRILEALARHPVVVVAGETGSGKTTQLPKMCLEAGLGSRARIGCTQPRRIAALSISRRLAEELQVTWGHEVGCRIRFTDQTRPETSLKVMTDGMLLAEVQGDPWLTEYEVILIDEAHERSLNIDFLLGHLRQLLQRRDDLKLVITSATIDTERFAAAFGGAPVIEVSGRLHPVEVRHRPLDEHAEEEGEITYVDAAVNAVEELFTEPGGGDLLVFMPTERDIREACDQLATRLGAHLDVVPLFGRLTAGEQHRIFEPGPRRRVVVATNIAETSLTVPRIRFVVDTGLARISRYHAGTRSRRLPVEPVSQSSARQRQGRCGRLAQGICVRLFSEADFEARRPFTEPEIQRANLADVILRLKAFGLGEIETFPFLDPPAPAAIQAAYLLLQELGALSDDRALTDLGAELARLPVDPTVGRMILQARRERAVPEVLVIAAGLSIQDPRERPFDRKDAAEAAHRRFLDPRSDFLTLLNIWTTYHDTWESLKTQNQVRKFCRTHFLSFPRMREWVDLHAQLEDALEDLGGARPSGAAAGYEAIHRAILAGLLGHLGQRESRNSYRVGGGRSLSLFPGSALFDKSTPAPKTGRRRAEDPPPTVRAHQPEWIVAGEIVETSRHFARTVAGIEPDWAISLAPHLVRRTYHDAAWDPDAGKVLATERVTLRGLVLQEQRVFYGRVAPAEATRIFIQSALLEAQLPNPPAFLEHNRQLLEKIEMWQTRLTQRVVPDLEGALAAFYARQLPQVASIDDLKRLLATQGGAGRLNATETDLLGEHAAAFARGDFPDTLTLPHGAVQIAYAYAPGEDRDGVTFRLAAPLLESTDAALLDWAVPALREERLRHLLQRLPKNLRRPLMPLNVAARDLLHHTHPTGPDFLQRLTTCIRERYGVEIPATAWSTDQLPAHLRPRFEILSRDGASLATGRDLNALRHEVRHHQTEDEKSAWQNGVQRWERYSLKDWDFEDPAEPCVIAELGGLPLHAYPGLQAEDHEVHLRLFRRREEAAQATREGLPRLAERVLHRDFAWLQKDLRALDPLKVLYVTLGPGDELKELAWDCLRRHLLADPPALPLRAEAFRDYVDRVRARLPGVVPPFIETLGAILRRRQELLLCRKPHPGLMADLGVLLPTPFLRHVPFDRLTQLPRYLQGLRIRAERAAVNPAGDAAKLKRIQPYLDASARLRAASRPDALPDRAREEFLWLVEEFRVSCFAQELGTAESVSPRKLDALLAAIGSQDAGRPTHR